MKNNDGNIKGLIDIIKFDELNLVYKSLCIKIIIKVINERNIIIDLKTTPGIIFLLSAKE